MKALWYRLIKIRKVFLIIAIVCSLFISYMITEEPDTLWPVIPFMAIYMAMIFGSNAIGSDQSNLFLTYAKALPFKGKQVVALYYQSSLLIFCTSFAIGLLTMLLRHYALSLISLPLYSFITGVVLSLAGLLFLLVFRFGQRIAQIFPVIFIVITIGGSKLLKALFTPTELSALSAKILSLGNVFFYGVFCLGLVLYFLTFLGSVSIYKKQGA